MLVRNAVLGGVGLVLWVVSCTGESFTGAEGGAGGGGAGGRHSADASAGQAGSGGSALAGSGGAQAGSGGTQSGGQGGAQAGSGGTQSGGQGGAHAGSGGTQSGGQGGGAGCEDEVAPADAIYVSRSLGAVGAPGTRAQPLASLAAAIAVAQGAGKVIVVSQGQYDEGPLRVDPGSWITIRGGYDGGSAGEWRRTCGDPPSQTRVSLPPGTGFESAGELSLDALTFTQRAPEGKTGKSSIGLMISGGSLTAENVAVTAAAGDSGAAPPSAPSGAPGSAQLTECKDGRDGEPGPAGTQQTPWSISAAGFAAGSAEAGHKGTKGVAGTPGGASVTRLDCKSCSCSNSCEPTTVTVSVGGGTCGEGGEPGPAGAGGLGGGASIALFLAPGVSVSLARVTLTADRGGSGSAGALGGDGGEGAPGAAGANSGACCREGCAKEGSGDCSSGCYSQPYLGGGVTGPCPTNRVVASSPGGGGGRGGKGGRGASGPPGPAFALVHAQSDAFVLPGSVTLRFAKGTPDADNGPKFTY